MFGKYLELTKPGIIRGNLLALIAGFMLASKGSVDFLLLLEVGLGVSLVIGSACVFNNYLDRSIDSKMDRTKNRSLVTNEISPRNALIFGFTLGVLGFATLALFTNIQTFIVGFIGWVFYIFIYGYYKRKSVHGTLIGAIPGATPPVAGYLTVSGHFDIATLLVFLILVFWQMPHFYAIALFRLKEYKNANIPVLPAVKGIKATQIQMICYILAFFITTILLFVFNYTGYVYLVIMILINAIWLKLAISGLKIKVYEKWAKKMFGYSLIVLLIFCFTLTFEFLLP